MVIYFLLFSLWAREVALTDLEGDRLTGRGCADLLHEIGCEDPRVLAGRGLKAHVEDMAHGHRLFVVPCHGDGQHTVYVAFWRRGPDLHRLHFDQNGANGLERNPGLLTRKLAFANGTMNVEGFGINAKYRFFSRPSGVTVHLVEQSRPREAGPDELLYWQRQ